MPSAQPGLFDTLPPGLRYRPELISPAEEAALAADLQRLPLAPFEFHGHLGKRRVAYFGWRYDFNGEGLQQAVEMPAVLEPLREAASAFARRPAADFVHALVTEYAPGAGIGWHRDRPQFGDVIGVSLLAPCPFRLRRRKAAGFERAGFVAEPRSAYLLSGEVREAWEHSIPPLESLRYSVTFRTLRDRRGPKPEA